MESLSLTATNLVLWAFPSAAEVAVGELTESQRVKISRLRQRINDKLKENPKARSALFDVENNSKFDLEKVAVYLQVAMYEDTEFAAEMKAICQELGTLPDDKGESQQKLIRKIGNQMIVGASGGALIGNILGGVFGAVPGAVAGATLGWWKYRNSRGSKPKEDSRDVE